MGQPESTSRRKGVEEEELLLLTKPPVVTLGRLLEELIQRKELATGEWGRYAYLLVLRHPLLVGFDMVSKEKATKDVATYGS